MKITSPSFDQNEPIPSQYTCDGADKMPPLHVSGVPETAKTLAIIMDDPDSPSQTWIHWTAWNIPAQEDMQLEETLPTGAMQGVNSFGAIGYGGPCPQVGEHRYFFKVFALDTELDLSSETSAIELEEALQGHVLDKAGLVGTYKKVG